MILMRLSMIGFTRSSTLMVLSTMHHYMLNGLSLNGGRQQCMIFLTPWKIPSLSLSLTRLFFLSTTRCLCGRCCRNLIAFAMLTPLQAQILIFINPVRMFEPRHWLNLSLIVFEIKNTCFVVLLVCNRLCGLTFEGSHSYNSRTDAKFLWCFIYSLDVVGPPTVMIGFIHCCRPISLGLMSLFVALTLLWMNNCVILHKVLTYLACFPLPDMEFLRCVWLDRLARLGLLLAISNLLTAVANAGHDLCGRRSSHGEFVTGLVESLRNLRQALSWWWRVIVLRWWFTWEVGVRSRNIQLNHVRQITVVSGVHPSIKTFCWQHRVQPVSMLNSGSLVQRLWSRHISACWDCPTLGRNWCSVLWMMHRGPHQFFKVLTRPLDSSGLHAQRNIQRACVRPLLFLHSVVFDNALPLKVGRLSPVLRSESKNLIGCRLWLKLETTAPRPTFYRITSLDLYSVHLSGWIHRIAWRHRKWTPNSCRMKKLCFFPST